MTQAEFEKLRAKLEDQLRADIEMLYEAHRVKLRAFETIRRAQAELEGEEVPPVALRRPVLTLPAGQPPSSASPEPATGKRREAWSVLDAIEDAFAALPDEFDKKDLARALGYEPSRATLFRALDMLREDGWIAVAEQGSGRNPMRFRKLPGAATAASRNTNEAADETQAGS